MSLISPSEVQHYVVQGVNGPTLVSTAQPTQLYTTADQAFLRQGAGLQKVLRMPTAPTTLVTSNGQVLQTTGGQVLQGVTANGQFLQGGQVLNRGHLVQGITANGQLVQGITTNGQLVQGITSNGQLVQGIANGQVLRGITANGQGVTISLDPTGYVATQPKYINASNGRIINAGLPVRPGQPGTAQMQTVRQVPTYITQAQPQVLMQGGVGDVTRLANGTIVSSNVTSAAAAAALATTNQFAQNRANTGFSGRTLLPMQTAAGQVAAAQPRPTLQQVIPGSAGMAVRPATGMAVRPTGTVFTTPTGATMIRPAVRIPKLGTVATYNPATGGLRTSPANNGVVGVMQAGQVPVQQVLQLQQAGGAGQVRPMLTSQQQLLASLRARMAALNNARSANGLVLNAGPGRVMGLPQNGTITLDEGTLLTRLLEAQARNTVVKVPATQARMQPLNSTAASITAALGAKNVGGLPDHQALLSAQTAAMNLTQSKVPARNNTNLDYVEMNGFSQGFKSPGSAAGDSPSFDALVPGQLPLSKTLSDVNTLSGADVLAVLGNGAGLGAMHQQRVGSPAMETQDPAKGNTDAVSQEEQGGNASGNKEDLKGILACIGVELARHGISVDAAVGAGWLGVLSQPDLAVLSDAYMAEVNRIKEEGDPAQTEKLGALMDASLEDMASLEGQVVLDSAQDMFLNADMSNGHFDAFSYGFFGDSAGSMKSVDDGALLEALEPEQGGESDQLNGGPTKMGEESQTLEPINNSSQVVNNLPNATRSGEDVQQAAGASSGSSDFAARFATLDLGCGFF